MNSKLFAISAIALMVLVAVSVEVPVEESDAATESYTTDVGNKPTGEYFTVTHTFGGSGYWNDAVYTISAGSKINCVTSHPTVTKSGSAYNWAFTVSIDIKPSQVGAFSLTVTLVTTGGFMSSNDTYTWNISGTAYAIQNTFTLAYDANGGSGAPATQTVTQAGTGYTATVSTSQPYRTNYSFLGWAESVSASTATIFGGDSITLYANTPKTLYAVWEYTGAPPVTSYTVSAGPVYPAYGSVKISGGGHTSTSSGSTDATLSVSYGTTVTATYIPASGYEFVQWDYMIGNYQYHSTSSTLTVSVTNDVGIAVVAQVTGFNLYFQSEDTSYGSVSASSVRVRSTSTSVSASGNTLTIPWTEYGTYNVYATQKSPDSQYIYFFDGWFDSNGNQITSSTSFSSSMTFTAKFHRELRAYDITIQSNNPTFGTVDIALLEDVPNGTQISNTGNLLSVGSTTVTATPTTSTEEYQYSFVNWTNGSGTVTSNLTITANFTSNLNEYYVTFEANNPAYGSFQPVNGISVPYGSIISVSNAMVTINNINISAVARASDGTYIYSFQEWDVESGDTVNGDMTITATFSRSAIDNTTYWTNKMMNGRVSMVFDWPSEETEIHNMAIPFYSGVVNPDYTTTWTDTSYVLNISLSYPNTNFAFELRKTSFPSVTLQSDTVTAGKWSKYELTIDAENGLVWMIPIDTFSSFMEYTTLDSQKTVLFDFSEWKKNVAISTIGHEDTGTGDHVKFSVTNTDVFLNTYGIVMSNPVINLYNHFPQYDKIRANFYAFAIYGDSFTINGTTYDVEDGTVTIQFVTDSQGNNLLPSALPTGILKTRTFLLNNIFVTWDGSHVFLTFDSARFTIDLGEYSSNDETISFTGIWYFTSVLYEPTTTMAKELAGWKVLPDLDMNQMLLIFLGILALVGSVAWIKLGGGIIDAMVMVFAGITAFILLV